MRVGVVGLYHESNTFMSSPTTVDDFRRGLLLRGKEFGERFSWDKHEVFGAFDGLRQSGVEIVPIFYAWATPSGTITADALKQLIDMMMLELSRAGTLDGVIVAPHGAAASEAIRDVDGYWEQVEKYLMGHAKVEFTHGICPDCVQKGVLARRSPHPKAPDLPAISP